MLAVVESCSPYGPGWQGKPQRATCFAWSLLATTGIPGLINPAPPSLLVWYQLSFLTIFITLLCTSASLWPFHLNEGDQCWSCFPWIPMSIMLIPLRGISYLICIGPPLGVAWVFSFCFVLFSWCVTLTAHGHSEVKYIQKLTFQRKTLWWCTHAEELHLRCTSNSNLGIGYLFHHLLLQPQ